jgi:hypothetical protein
MFLNRLERRPRAYGRSQLRGSVVGHEEHLAGMVYRKEGDTMLRSWRSAASQKS